MSRWNWMMAAAFAFLSAGLLAGCSGKKSSATPTAGPATETSVAATEIGDALPQEMKAITAKLSGATFKGTYTLTTSGSAGVLSDGRLVLYKQGDKRIRYDVTGKQDGQVVQLVFIEDGDASLFCLKDPSGIEGVAGAAVADGVCVHSAPDDQSAAGSIGNIFSDVETADVTVLDKSSRTIAGVEADCYRSKDNRTAKISTICFGADGAVLYATSEGDSASEIVATQITSGVSDADFNPPYPVTDIPGLGG